MTKELTEQWKNGTLKTGSYYIRIITGNEKSDYFEGKKFCFWSDYEVEEVLAPVPSYDHFVELTEKANQFSQMVKKVDELEKENAELLEKIEELTTKCNQLAKKVKKRGMQIERAYDRYVAKRKENSELVQKIHILNEANINLENTVGKLGEQLKEANRVIKHYADGSIYLFPTWYNGSFEANNYLEKWGVK